MGAGRPKKEIDQKQFENLCALQCTEVEIEDWFDVTDKTLNAWCKRTYGKNFSEVFRIKRGRGKISLRRNQWQLAEKSASMAIWLGKQYLGQSDNPTTELPGNDAEEDALSKAIRETAEALEEKNEWP